MSVGNTKTIEAASEDGRKIAVLVRMSYEIAENLTNDMDGYVNDLFSKFCEEVEELFKGA